MHSEGSPALQKLAVTDAIEAYNFPQGVVAQLLRDTGGGKPGLLTRVGLGTFADPRHGGGKVNDRTTEDRVRLLEIDGEEYLLYQAFERLAVAFLRGSTADPDGNIAVTVFVVVGGPKVSHVNQPAQLLVAAAVSVGIAAMAGGLVIIGAWRHVVLASVTVAAAAGVLYGLQDVVTRGAIIAGRQRGLWAVVHDLWPYLLVVTATAAVLLTQRAFRAARLDYALPPLAAAQPVLGVILAYCCSAITSCSARVRWRSKIRVCACSLRAPRSWPDPRLLAPNRRSPPVSAYAHLSVTAESAPPRSPARSPRPSAAVTANRTGTW